MRRDIEEATRLRESGKLDEAERVLSRLLEEFPEDAEANYQFAWLCDLRGQEARAVPFYERAVAGELAEDDLKGAFLGLGSTYRALGRYEEAGKTLREGVARYPNERVMHVFLALALYNLGDHGEATAILIENLIETTSDSGIKSYERALAFYADRLDEVSGSSSPKPHHS